MADAQKMPASPVPPHSLIPVHMQARSSRSALVFILVTVTLDVLALGLMIPILPKLVEGMLGGDTPEAARIYGWFGTAFAVLQFAFMPVLGALSDRFGRRPVILLSNLGMGLGYVLMALATSLWWLFAARVIAGITSASISTAHAYIADVTAPEKRAQAMGMTGAAFGIGFVVGPAVGGLLGHVDPRLPLWVAAGLSLANFLYGWLVLPESLPKARRSAFVLAKANPFGALTMLAGHPRLLRLAVVVFLSGLAYVVLPSTFVLYAGYRFGWQELEVGLMLAAVGICSAIVQAGLIRRIVPRLGEQRALLLGLAVGAAGFAGYGLAPVGWLFAAFIPVWALWGITGPTANSLATKQVAPHEQGRLQGALASVTAFGGIVGPGVFTQTFAAFAGPDAPVSLPGAAFLLAAVLLAVAAALSTRIGAEKAHAPA